MFGSDLFAKQRSSEVEIDLQPGVQAPSPWELERLLEDAPVIDLGSPKRDEAIMPTTWHTC